MVWEANPSIEVPQSLASLKWVPHSGFRPILFPLCTNNQWDFTGLKASQGTQQNRASHGPNCLGICQCIDKNQGIHVSCGARLPWRA